MVNHVYQAISVLSPLTANTLMSVTHSESAHLCSLYLADQVSVTLLMIKGSMLGRNKIFSFASMAMHFLYILEARIES